MAYLHAEQTSAGLYEKIADKTAYLSTPVKAGTDTEESDSDTTSDVTTTLVVTTKDKTTHRFVLVDNPKAFFDGTDFRIVSAKADVSIPIESVQNFIYEKKSSTGIDDISIDYDPTEFDYRSDGTLVISQLKAGAQVSVYSFDGKMVRRLIADRTGTYRLSLSTLPQGVYLVKAVKITYKIMKR